MSQTAQGLLRNGRKTLAEAGIDTADIDARLLLQHITSWTHAQLIARADDLVDDAAVAQFEACLARRLVREPISKITGQREFWSLDFIVTPDVLDPRPDTEILVEAVLEQIRDKNVALQLVDLGTGSGCIPIALLSELPNATAIAVDQSEAALAVAQRNAVTNGVADRMEVLCSDWADGLGEASADIVVSNPPYIPSGDIQGLEAEVRDFDPLSALDGGSDGLDAYKKIIADLPRVLRPGGWVFFEVGIGQAGQVSDLLREIASSETGIKIDLSGIPRCVFCKT